MSVTNYQQIQLGLDFCYQNNLVFNSSCSNETCNKDHIENQKDRRKIKESEQ